MTNAIGGAVPRPGREIEQGSAQMAAAIADERSPEEVAATVAKLGLEPVWKDWDPALAGPP